MYFHTAKLLYTFLVKRIFREEMEMMIFPIKSLIIILSFSVLSTFHLKSFRNKGMERLCTYVMNHDVLRHVLTAR